MKTNKINLIICLLLAMVMGISACSDEFNESEFIKEQADLAESKAAKDHERALAVIQAQLDATLAAITAQANVDTELAQLQALLNKELEMLRESLSQKEDSLSAANYLAAYRAAGLFTEFKVLVNNRDGEPLADAEVRVSSIPDAVTTGADGSAVFTDVVVGNNTLTVSSDAILDFRANVLFNRLNLLSMGTSTIVEPATALLALNLFADMASSDEVGTISGTVTIETDLTNDTPEFPAGAVVSADLSNYLMTNNVIAFQDPNLGGVNGMALTEGNLGVGEIDPTTGNYELKVPLAGNSSSVNLIFPEIMADQTLAISERDGNDIPAEIATVPTRFNLNVLAEEVDDVIGFEVSVNEPATLGSGFEMAFTPMAFDIYNFSSTNLTDINGQTRTFSNGFTSTAQVRFKLKSTGAGYTSTPSLRIGSSTVGYGYLEGYLTSLNVEEDGSAYGNEQNVTLTAYAYFGGNQVINFGSKNITSQADGTLPETILIEEGDFNFTKNTRQIITQKIDSIGIVVTGVGADAVVRPNVNLSVYGFTIDNAPDASYTTFPSLTFVGGGATTQAVLEITTYNRYDMNISNSGTGYTIEPSIEITGSSVSGSQVSLYQSNQVEYYSKSNQFPIGSVTLNSFIERDGAGGLTSQNDGYRAATDAGVYFESTPSIRINDLNAVQMVVNVAVNDPKEGDLTAFVLNTGDGYDANRTVTVTPRIAGVGGSGFQWIFNDTFNNSTGEYSFNSNEIVNNGAGYKQNLNIDKKNPNTGSNIINVTIRRGETTNQNVDYGTGVRLENVGGDN